MIFKCVNTDVADLVTGEIFNRALLPIHSWGHNDIIAFMQRRVYSSHNKIARAIDQRREERIAFKLGLSDSYWISYDKNVKFEDVSPYYQEFGTLDFVTGFTEPTLRLMGTFDKEWRRIGNRTVICKREPVLVAEVEARASELATVLGVGHKPPALYVGVNGGDGIVFIHNMSSPSRMFLDFGSILKAESLNEGTVIREVQDMYDSVGLRNIGDYIARINLFDGVIGNEDRRRNQGNWGFYKSTTDGKVSLMPAYDFNLAYSLDVDEALMNKRIAGIKAAKKGTFARLLLEQWDKSVMDFCGRYGYNVWHRNLRRMYMKLK